MLFVGYIFLFPLVWLISLLPLPILYDFSNFLYFLIYHIARYRRKVVYENLRNSFPEKSEKEINEIAKKFYKYFSHLIVEIIKLFNISDREFKERIKLRNPELLNELCKNGIHCIVVTAHYGNWEWLAGITDKDIIPYKIMSVYKPLKNIYIDNMLNRFRSRFGTEMVPMTKVLKVMVQNKNDGIPVISLFIADQTPMRHQIQYWTKFLNQDAPIFLGVEKLAKLTKQAVLFLRIIPVKSGYYEAEAIKLFEDVSNVSDYEITEAHVRLLENVIREKPEFWLWTHRRWKLSYLKSK